MAAVPDPIASARPGGAPAGLAGAARIEARFERLRARGGKGLIPFVTAGDPHPSRTVPLMHALAHAGADLIELGVPFSDPMADGPAIQRASERALAEGVHLSDVLGQVAEFRRTDTDTPVVLMGYLNPVEAMGWERFADEAAVAGVDGVLLVDLPPEEDEEGARRLRASGLAPIRLAAPTSTERRLRRICAAASGFLYCVSLKGVTGSDDLDLERMIADLERVRRHTSLPLAAGFGIKDAGTAVRAAAAADAVVVGSALVERIEREDGDPCTVAAGFVRDLRRALDAAGEGASGGNAGAGR